MALNSGPTFKSTEAISLFTDCSDQDEADRLCTALTAEDEGSPGGRLKDRYGLSWQIIPRVLGEWMQDADPGKARRVMEAMLQMRVICVGALQ